MQTPSPTNISFGALMDAVLNSANIFRHSSPFLDQSVT